MQKKGQFYTGLVIALLCILTGAVVFGVGYLTNWYGLGEEKEETTGPTYTPPSKEGDYASLKYLVKVIDPSVIQFAGTGFCWDVAKPSELLESVSGKTLSATAGTSFSPALRGKTYECTAFDSTHWCEHDKETMGPEALQLESTCYNLSVGSNGVKVTLFEDDTAETANSEGLTISAGSTKQFNKFLVEINQSYKAFPVKALCFKSNASTSHINNMIVSGFTKDGDKPSSSYDYCFQLSTAKLVENKKGVEIFNNPIIVYADSTGFGTHEAITWTMWDECEYVADTDGYKGVQTDYYKRHTIARSDCGATNPTDTFKLQT